MNDDPRMPEDHPEAELTSYLDGSATAEERRLVDGHLAECASCRADLEFAARGRAAMQALPQLESPSLAASEIGWLPADGQEAATVARRAGRDRARRRAGRRSYQVPAWQRVAWGAGIAAAASLAAVFLFSSLNGNPNKATTAAGPARDQAQSAIRSSTDYDRASLDALASGLAQQTAKERTSAESANTLQGSPVPQVAPAAGGAASATFSEALDQDTATRALGCLRQGAGLPSTAAASYLEVASFGGTPAFIGAFPDSPSGGTPTQLQVIAVDQASCQALYVVTLPL
jgi:hypothetical protein